MHSPRSARPLLSLALLAALMAPAAPAKVTYKTKPAAGTGPAPCEPLAGPAPDSPARPLDRVGLNFPSDFLTSVDSATVRVCALVDSMGIVRQARIERGGTPLDSAAVD